MTIQIKDRIYLDGKLYELLSTPLESFLEARFNMPKLRGRNSNCWRGYVASWRIRNNVLFLTGFQQVSPRIVFNTNEIITSTKLVAEWYTGILRIPVGYVIHHYSNDVPLHEKEIHIYVESGLVMNHEVIHNKYVPSDESDDIPF